MNLNLNNEIYNYLYTSLASEIVQFYFYKISKEKFSRKEFSRYSESYPFDN